MKKHIITLIAAAAILAFAVGTISLGAASKPGSQDDPLITLSYLNDVVKKQVTDQTTIELNEKLAAIERDLNAKIESSSGASVKFEVVTLDAGETLTLPVGSELLLRLGSASCISSASSGLVDTTGGVTLENGKQLEKNHLYIVTVGDCGVKADASITLLVCRG